MLMAMVFFMAQFLETGLGYGPLGAGLRLLPGWAMLTLIAPFTGRSSAGRGSGRWSPAAWPWRRRHDLDRADRPARPALRHLVAPLLLAGCGVSVAIPATMSAVMTSVPPAAIGQASGILNTLRQLGGVFGVAICAAVFAARGDYASPASVRPAALPRPWAPALAWPCSARYPAWSSPAAAAHPSNTTHPRPERHTADRHTEDRDQEITMQQRLIRYRTKPDQAAANAELVRAVYAELHHTRPDGFRYATLMLDDQVTFVHIVQSEHDPSPILAVKAFGEFQAGIMDRCDQPPAAAGLHRDWFLPLPERLALPAATGRTVTATTSSQGVGFRPKVAWAAEESMTKSSRNWYSVSRSSRMSGQTSPIPRSSTGGTVPTRT